MPITLQCPTCGSILSVPNSVAGRVVQCPSCGGQTIAPAQAAPLVVAAAVAVPAPRRAAPARTAAAQYECSNCGGMFTESQVFDDEGSIVCQTCYSSIHPGVDPTASAAESDPATAGLPVVQLTCALCRGRFDPAEMEEQDGRPVCHNCINTGRGKIGFLDRKQQEEEKFDSKLPMYAGVGICVALLLTGVLLYMNSGTSAPSNGDAQTAAPAQSAPGQQPPTPAPLPALAPATGPTVAELQRADWIKTNRAQVLQMLKDADLLAENEDYQRAYNKYTETMHFAAGHVGSETPDLYDALEAIRTKEKKLVQDAATLGVAIDTGAGPMTTAPTSRP